MLGQKSTTEQDWTHEFKVFMMSIEGLIYMMFLRTSITLTLITMPPTSTGPLVTVSSKLLTEDL